MKRGIRDKTSLDYIDHVVINHLDFYSLIVELLLKARKLLQQDPIDSLA